MGKKTIIVIAGSISAFLLGWWAYDKFYLNKKKKVGQSTEKKKDKIDLKK